MSIQLIDYVQDAEVKDGSIFNGMTVRVVGADVLFDYAGMNPSEARNMGMTGIKDDEILLNSDTDSVDKETANHELNEDRELRADPKLTYWEVHTALQKLAEPDEPDVNLSINHMEAKDMPNDLITRLLNTSAKELPDRTMEFVGSLETSDRMGDSVKVEGWKTANYLKNPVFLWCHDYHNPPIGKAIKVWAESGKLMFQIKFADAETYPFADIIYRLYKGGFLSAVSVGFAPQSEPVDNGKGYDFTNQELLELSAVPVPAHQDALVSARSQGVISVKEFQSVTKYVQKPEVTENYIRIPVEDPDKHKGCKIRTIDISEKDGIKALYCVDDKVVLTYLFDKDKFTQAEAEKWVKDHKKAFTPHEISQEQIKDEIDYLREMADQVGLSEVNKALLRRIAGSDMPVLDKALTNKVKVLVKEAMDACDEAQKTMAEHHKAHNKAYSLHSDIVEKAKKALSDMCPEEPAEGDHAEPDEDDKSLLGSLPQTKQNPIMAAICK